MHAARQFSPVRARPFRFAFLGLPVMTKSYTRYGDDDVFRPEHFSGWGHHGALNRNVDHIV